MVGRFFRAITSARNSCTRRASTRAASPLACTLIAQLAPALVVLDLAMPGTDGFTVAETIQKGRGPSTPPVLIFTGLPRDRAARATGASAFCAKPIEPRHFLAAVRRLCPLAEEGTTR